VKNVYMILPAVLLMGAGCGASFPAPTQRMADAESAERSARELGADAQPAAKLEVELAHEQIAQAKLLVAGEQNKRADFVLIRARADAELALALAREQAALTNAVKATDQSNTMFNSNVQGAGQ
jgi:Domain of unknown function (DUF4398)